MDKNKQKIKRNNNIQIGVNNAPIVNTKKVLNTTLIEYNPQLHISDAQAKQIRDMVQENAHAMAQRDNISSQKAYSTEYSVLYKKFSITSYKLLPKDKFEEAIKFLQKRIRYTGHKVDRTKNKEAFRNRNYKGIYARARQLGMHKEGLLLYAEEVLDLKKPISSLKELSDTRLEKLYRKIFSKRIS